MDTKALVAAAKFFRDRDEIVAAGFVPGWNGETAKEGEQAVIFGRGQWRLVTITKVTRLQVTGVYTTPGAIAEAMRIAGRGAAIDPEVWGREAATNAAINWDWRSYAATGTEGQPWHRPGTSRRPTSLTLTQKTILDSRDWIAQQPDRDAHIQRERDAAIQRAERQRDEALRDGYEAYLTITKASGRRDGTRTNLYVQPR